MRDLKLLHPWLLERYSEFAYLMAKAGIGHIVTCTLRTQEEHDALWAQGRSPLNVTNELRAKVKLAPITHKQNERKVTWTQRTKHFADKDGYSHAFDIALLSDVKRPHWNLKVDVNLNEIPDYEEAGKIGERVGLRAGINFGDAPHFEVPLRWNDVPAFKN